MTELTEPLPNSWVVVCGWFMVAVHTQQRDYGIPSEHIMASNKAQQILHTSETKWCSPGEAESTQHHSVGKSDVEMTPGQLIHSPMPMRCFNCEHPIFLPVLRQWTHYPLLLEVHVKWAHLIIRKDLRGRVLTHALPIPGYQPCHQAMERCKFDAKIH